MTREEFEQVMSEGKEFLEFERVQNPRSQRPDLHAFILLDTLQPGTKDIVCSAAHDEIWLDIDVDALAAVITKDQCIELQRCGIRYDESTDSLALFT